MANDEYCYRCGQSRSTHDDGECEAVKRSMSIAASRVLAVPYTEPHEAGPGAHEIARRLTAMADVARGVSTLAGWAWMDEQVDSLKEMIALETWKMGNGRAKENG